ncbi:MAG TPA: hypothetical protein VH302_16600 [Bryobacteraceae bacterium]|jgi:hypothetical protein|nr:hypothetical protein [Bryobacteraceae bacterium]
MRELWAVIFKQYSTGTVLHLLVWRRFITFASFGLRALRAPQERD